MDSKKITLLISFFLVISCIIGASEKLYIDSDELDTHACGMFIHVGHNVWLETKSIHSDERGIFTLESDIVRLEAATKCISGHNAYTQQWKCPYCYNYWPIGQACQNANCPSKYR